ncbi:MAG TPA: hypothetical protein VF173_04220 [Thermoanaerobaculia bacterium]|nr:hypothetical protein [Thermoanaerobaculia bacterium]
MSRIPLARSVLLLLLALFAAVPFVSAAAPPDRAVSYEAGRFVSPPLFSRLWSWLTAIWEKNGCGIDPHGNCLPGTGAAPAPLPTAAKGCSIDPDGRCRA